MAAHTTAVDLKHCRCLFLFFRVGFLCSYLELKQITINVENNCKNIW